MNPTLGIVYIVAGVSGLVISYQFFKQKMWWPGVLCIGASLAVLYWGIPAL